MNRRVRILKKAKESLRVKVVFQKEKHEKEIAIKDKSLNEMQNVLQAKDKEIKLSELILKELHAVASPMMTAN